MLGSGRAEPHRVIRSLSSDPEWTTLDIDPDVEPDVVWDLNRLRGDCPGCFDESGYHKLPFEDEQFDEIHIRETLHMYGKQGDFRGWFNEFGEYWRILKPGGLFCSVCPAPYGLWAWADPGCTRMIHPVNIKYLAEEFYENLGTQPLTDYRKYVKGWWRIVLNRVKDGTFTFILQKEEK
jgi:SAM-dependent methyltransferase